MMPMQCARKTLEKICPGRFAMSFLGTGILLLWLQCVSYARYVWVDAGMSTVMIDLSRSAYIIVLVGIVLAGLFTLKFQRALGWVSVGVMTLGTFLFFLQESYPDLGLMLAAAICSGTGLAWVGGMWMHVYMRMAAREAFFYGFVSLALSAILGVPMGLVPSNIALLASMFLPVVAFMMFLRSAKILESRTGVPVPSQAIPEPEDDAYRDEPRSSLVRLLVGVALSSFVIGVSRGFPFGTSIHIGAGLQATQFVTLIALSVLTIWLVLVRGKRYRMSTIWWAILVALALSILLLATFNEAATLIGATIIAVVNLYRVAFMWVSVVDFGRHRKGSVFFALAAVWFLHLSFRSFGRLLVLWFAQGETTGSTVLIALLLFMLIGSTALVLSSDIPRLRPLFAGINILPAMARQAAQGRPARPGTSTPNTSGLGASSSADVNDEKDATSPDGIFPRETASHQDALLHHLRDTFGLTAREAEVALLLAEGRTAAYIAREFSLSQNTVRGYMRALYAKMGIHSKQELIDLMREPPR